MSVEKVKCLMDGKVIVGTPVIYIFQHTVGDRVMEGTVCICSQCAKEAVMSPDVTNAILYSKMEALDGE